MASQDYNKTIEQILSLHTDRELEVEDSVTNLLLDEKSSNVGCKISFVGSYKRQSEVSEWTEYRVLYKVIRYKDTPVFLNKSIEFIKDATSHLEEIKDCESVGIQEVYCIDPFNYYILIYIVR